MRSSRRSPPVRCRLLAIISRALMAFLTHSCYFARAFQMLAVPEFESNEIPDHFAVIRGVACAMKIAELVDKFGAEIAALAGARIVQHVLHQRVEFRFLQKPES